MATDDPYNDPSKDPSQGSYPEGSYELTNERTNEEGRTSGDQAAVPNARGGVEEFLSIADVIEAGFLPTGDRFPISRTGERAEIPWHIRAAVYYRDGARCQTCKILRPRPWHLDHIVPWSAGGPDTTDNLRLLCEACNMRRSNFDLRDVFPKLPCTWWCHRCYDDTTLWEYLPNGAVLHYEPPIDSEVDEPERDWHACRVQAITLKQAQQGEHPTWHKIPPIEDFAIRAFCAHCNQPGMTGVTL